MPANGKIVLITGVSCGPGRPNDGFLSVIHRAFLLSKALPATRFPLS